MPFTNLTAEQKATLLNIAKSSIEFGLLEGNILQLDLTQYDSQLQEKGASFVSLHRFGELKGCIGKLQAIQALAQDVAENAYNSAFYDPRFTPLQKSELTQIEIEISVLHPARELQFENERQLIEKLRPGKDGVILQASGRRGTFLPVVWNTYDNPQIFFNKLKIKAGLPENYWSEDLRCWIYETETFA